MFGQVNLSIFYYDFIIVFSDGANKMFKRRMSRKTPSGPSPHSSKDEVVSIWEQINIKIYNKSNCNVHMMMTPD